MNLSLPPCLPSLSPFPVCFASWLPFWAAPVSLHDFLSSLLLASWCSYEAAAVSLHDFFPCCCCCCCCLVSQLISFHDFPPGLLCVAHAAAFNPLTYLLWSFYFCLVLSISQKKTQKSLSNVFFAFCSQWLLGALAILYFAMVLKSEITPKMTAPGPRDPVVRLDSERGHWISCTFLPYQATGTIKRWLSPIKPKRSRIPLKGWWPVKGNIFKKQL